MIANIDEAIAQVNQMNDECQEMIARTQAIIDSQSRMDDLSRPETRVLID